MSESSFLDEGQAAELNRLLASVTPALLNFVRQADIERAVHAADNSADSVNAEKSLIHPLSSSRPSLETKLADLLIMRDDGCDAEGIQDLVQTILTYSVNPSAPGFMDKLYAAPLPPGILAELILGVLNTNVHVYQVSPVLTLIEKHVTRELSHIFGLTEPRGGGVSVQGGSASNMASIVIARNTLFPQTKLFGNGAVGGQLLLYTSAHGHYSVEKAAQALGFGSKSVVVVSVDRDGRMIPSELDKKIEEAKDQGKVPFYINATAGTTVLGSFDPFVAISKVAKKHSLWLHVDGAWGGSFAFSQNMDLKRRLQGVELADSIATNPHKMLGVPMTCSFLLARDLRQFQQANTLKAGYLFHDDGSNDDETLISGTVNNGSFGVEQPEEEEAWNEPYDLADLTLQCGRRGDSLKFFLSWKYYGTLGYAKLVDRAYDVACHMLCLVQADASLTSVLTQEAPGCLQVCFYFTPQGRFTYGLVEERGYIETENELNHKPKERPTEKTELGKLNSRVTANVTKTLIQKGFMIDFAPALEGQEDRGSFFRVVVNISTVRGTVERLVRELVDAGYLVVDKIHRRSKRPIQAH